MSTVYLQQSVQCLSLCSSCFQHVHISDWISDNFQNFRWCNWNKLSLIKIKTRQTIDEDNVWASRLVGSVVLVGECDQVRDALGRYVIHALTDQQVWLEGHTSGKQTGIVVTRMNCLHDTHCHNRHAIKAHVEWTLQW